MDIMTKVRVLWEKVAGITADVSAVDAKATATAATLAGILPRIPADYSETETATGQKWIDGKEIYCKVINGDLPSITGSSNVVVESELNIDLIINLYAITRSPQKTVQSTRYGCSYQPLTGFSIYSVGSGYSEGDFTIVAYYTKPDPVPAQADKGTGMITGEDPEPETRKRKTTKKEDK